MSKLDEFLRGIRFNLGIKGFLTSHWGSENFRHSGHGGCFLSLARPLDFDFHQVFADDQRWDF